jgi:hypothetical protein
MARAVITPHASMPAPKSPLGASDRGSVHSEANKRAFLEYPGLLADDRFGGKQVGERLVATLIKDDAGQSLIVAQCLFELCSPSLSWCLQFSTQKGKAGAGPDVTFSPFQSLHVGNEYITAAQLKS